MFATIAEVIAPLGQLISEAHAKIQVARRPIQKKYDFIVRLNYFWKRSVPPFDEEDGRVAAVCPALFE